MNTSISWLWRLIQISPLLLCALAFRASGQSNKPLLKGGVFPYFRDSKVSGFSAHIELERAWKRHGFLTSGPRLDYVDVQDSHPDLYLGYELKFYPLYWTKRNPYHGIFLGVVPLYLLQDPGDGLSRRGPGLGSIAGYQHLFNDRISLSFEGCMVYFQNINSKAIKDNSADRYFTLFASLKLGIKL